MPDPIYIMVFCAWFVGGFVSGVSGIGGAMVAVPVAAMFIPMHDLIPLSCILNVIMDGCIACMHFRHCRVSALWPMLVGSIPGAIIGLFILQFVSGAILQGAVGALLLYYVYWQQTFHVKKSIRNHGDEVERLDSEQVYWEQPFHSMARPLEHMDYMSTGNLGSFWEPLAYSSSSEAP